METAIDLHPTRLGFVEKLRVVLACVVAVYLMRIAGWIVAQPADPDMAVTLASGGRGLTAWPTLLGLTVVTALIGTAIAGRRPPEAGVFAAGIGLTGLALRGGSMEMVLAYQGGNTPEERKTLMLVLALDCLCWAAILAVTWFASRFAWQWLWGRSDAGAPADPAETAKPKVNKQNTPEREGPRSAWPALVVTAVVALFVIWLTISPTPVRPIARSQVIGSVVLGLFLGAMAARYFTGVHDPRWYVLAPLVVALIGYALGYVNADMKWAEDYSGGTYYAQLSTTPSHALVRPLPVEYIALGVAAAIAGFWSGEKIEHVAEQEREIR